MKDSLDILCTGNFVEHHGVKGMKWGVRKKEYAYFNSNASSTNRGFEGRKKNTTQGGNGAFKRGEGMHLKDGWDMNTGDINSGVGGSGSYHNSISDGTGFAPVSTQLGQALYSAVYKEIRETEEYKKLKQLIDEYKKLADDRKKTWNQGSTAASMVFEEKANKLIREINSTLGALDDKYREKTKLINKTAYKDFSPSKSVLEGFSSSGLNIDKSGRVSKGWKSSPTVPKDKIGWRL